MSHNLDFESVQEKCFLLEHIVNGSSKYCCDRNTGSEEDQGDGEFDNYWSWTKGIVSTYLLDCAIKIRVIQDTIRDKKDIIDLNSLDDLACKNLIIGKIIEGNFKLTLRESCNKIIHAQKAILEWAESNKDQLKYKYWSGRFQLVGSMNEKNWILIIDINQWAKATYNFIKILRGTDAFHYIGQDWY